MEIQPLEFQDIFNALEEIPHVGNSTVLEKVRTFVESTSSDNWYNWVMILAIVGIIFSVLVFAIVYKVKSHKRR